MHLLYNFCKIELTADFWKSLLVLLETSRCPRTYNNTFEKNIQQPGL